MREGEATPAGRPEDRGGDAPPPPPPTPGDGLASHAGVPGGPQLPPPPPATRFVQQGFGYAQPGFGYAQPAAHPATDQVRAIPLGTRELVRQALDLLTRSDTGLRSASFYIGFLMLVTVGPAVVLLGLALVNPQVTGDNMDPEAALWFGWLLLAVVPATLGYMAAGVEARALATAVIGGRAEGRPLRLEASIAVARARFWRVLGAQVLIGLVVGLAGAIAQVVAFLIVGPAQVMLTGVSLVASLLVGMAFVYAPAGIVLGEVGVGDAVTRSFTLFALRKRLAIVVTAFSVLSQFIVLIGFSAGADLIARLVVGSGLTEDFPAPLVVPIAAALVFALGTLTFLVEAIAAAPAVHAFEALTHYTGGLEVGRRQPATGRLGPWVTPGLALCALVGLVALVGGALTFPG